MRSGFVIAAVALALVAAGPASAATKRFRTPSNNIHCLYSPSGGPEAFLRCDVLSLNDTGFVLLRGQRGKRVRVTDSVAGSRSRVLRYGRKLALGPFRCASRRSGLTCRQAGHGFSLSRERQRVF